MVVQHFKFFYVSNITLYCAFICLFFCSCNSFSGSTNSLQDSKLDEKTSILNLTGNASKVDLNSQIITSQNIDSFSYHLYGRSSGVFLSSGTAAFIRVNSNDYLVSAFHVLTGKNPVTHGLMYKSPIDQLLIQLRRMGKDSQVLWVIPVVLQISGQSNVMLFDNGIDIGLVKLNIPDSLKPFVHPIDYKNIDFDTTLPIGRPLTAVGFPLDQTSVFGNPVRQNGVSINPPIGSGINPCLYYSNALSNGGSGAPVFEQDPVRGVFKLVGIHSQNDLLNYPPKSGTATWMYWGAELIGR